MRSTKPATVRRWKGLSGQGWPVEPGVGAGGARWRDREPRSPSTINQPARRTGRSANRAPVGVEPQRLNSPCRCRHPRPCLGQKPGRPSAARTGMKKEAKAVAKLVAGVARARVAHTGGQGCLASGCRWSSNGTQPMAAGVRPDSGNERWHQRPPKPKRPTLRTPFHFGPYVGPCDGGWEGVLEQARPLARFVLLAGGRRTVATTIPWKLRPDGQAALAIGEPLPANPLWVL